MKPLFFAQNGNFVMPTDIMKRQKYEKYVKITTFFHGIKIDNLKLCTNNLNQLTPELKG